MTAVGIVSLGSYLPERRETSEDIARASGVSLEIVEEKMGIRAKPRAGRDDHASTMALAAAREALADADPLDLDLIVYSGSMHKDHYVWSAAAKIQGELGARNAYAFELVSLCSTNVLALKVARDLMSTDDRLRTVLICGGHRTGDLIDYRNANVRFLFNLSDGGSAILLRRDHAANRVLGSAFITDGRFADAVRIPAGGSRMPQTTETLARGLHLFDVADPRALKEQLDPVSSANFLSVVREALARSGLDQSDMGFLSLNHMKRSIHDRLLKELGLSQEQAIYLEDIGHIGAPDQVIALQRAIAEGRVRDGSLVVMAAAGLGFTWGATVVRWGASQEGS